MRCFVQDRGMRGN